MNLFHIIFIIVFIIIGLLLVDSFLNIKKYEGGKISTLTDEENLKFKKLIKTRLVPSKEGKRRFLYLFYSLFAKKGEHFIDEKDFESAKQTERYMETVEKKKYYSDFYKHTEPKSYKNKLVTIYGEIDITPDYFPKLLEQKYGFKLRDNLDPIYCPINKYYNLKYDKDIDESNWCHIFTLFGLEGIDQFTVNKLRQAYESISPSTIELTKGKGASDSTQMRLARHLGFNLCIVDLTIPDKENNKVHRMPLKLFITKDALTNNLPWMFSYSWSNSKVGHIIYLKYFPINNLIIDTYRLNELLSKIYENKEGILDKSHEEKLSIWKRYIDNVKNKISLLETEYDNAINNRNYKLSSSLKKEIKSLKNKYMNLLYNTYGELTKYQTEDIYKLYKKTRRISPDDWYGHIPKRRDTVDKYEDKLNIYYSSYDKDKDYLDTIKYNYFEDDDDDDDFGITMLDDDNE